MQVGDLVFMHNIESGLGIIIDKKFKGINIDRVATYQVKWFYTLADDFMGYRGAGNWYYDHHIGSVDRYLAAR